MKSFGVTIGKEKNYNEDSIKKSSKLIAVSDGAGGGGIFADKWSQYLMQNLSDSPISSFECMDKWVDSIWEEFYKQYEKEARKLGSIELSKFYDEGAFATLAAIWINDKKGNWISYGDSVVFCYNPKTKELASSIETLSSFNNAPYLISCNESLEPSGFKSGIFKNINDCILFCASDALAHYILASYRASSIEYKALFEEAVSAKSKNSNFIKAILQNEKLDFEKDVLHKLIRCSKNKANFKKHMEKLQREGKIAIDDYSICFLIPDSFR